jgi:hypothetical protein
MAQLSARSPTQPLVLTDFDRELAIFSQMLDLSPSSADTARH